MVFMFLILTKTMILNFCVIILLLMEIQNISKVIMLQIMIQNLKGLGVFLVQHKLVIQFCLALV